MPGRVQGAVSHSAHMTAVLPQRTGRYRRGRARRGRPAVPGGAEDPEHKRRRPGSFNTGLLADKSPEEEDQTVLGLPFLNYLIV